MESRRTDAKSLRYLKIIVMIPRPAVFEEAKMTIESEGNDPQEKDALKLSVVSTPLVLNTPLNKENEERREEAVSNLQSGDENFSESDSEDEDEEFFSKAFLSMRKARKQARLTPLLQGDFARFARSKRNR